jgi:uncharacterized protein (TIGR00252 family)
VTIEHISNYLAGHEAEKQAAQYLRELGFKIRQLNWRTRFCEIDIVAEKSRRIYFVEVKYRRNAMHGQGYDYITPKKLQQMHFAAALWLAMHYSKYDAQLAVVSMDGATFRLDLVET